MESKDSYENEAYVAPECEVIELGVENCILNTSPTGSHEGFGEEDWNGGWD